MGEDLIELEERDGKESENDIAGELKRQKQRGVVEELEEERGEIAFDVGRVVNEPETLHPSFALVNKVHECE